MMAENFTVREEDAVAFWKKERKADTHKGDYGRVYIIAGSVGMTGAAALCAQSALKAGCGLVYIITKPVSMPVYEVLVPEAVKIPVNSEQNTEFFTVDDVDYIFDIIKNPSCIVIGPGLGNNVKTKQFVRRFLKNYKESGFDNIPLVIDADGINSFEGKLNLLSECVNENCVITPHCMEASVISAEAVNYISENRKQFMENLLKKIKCNVVLKGHKTLIGCVDKQGNSIICENTSGNAGMASAGSGDVLSGIIAGFIATDGKEEAIFNCVKYGVYIHGLCADIAREKYGQRYITASCLIDQLGEIHKKG